MSEPSDLSAHYRDLGSVLRTPEGRQLLEHLEARFCERRVVVEEAVVDSQTQRPMRLQRVQRVTSFTPGDAYATHKWEGCREVVLYLKDLQEWEE